MNIHYKIVELWPDDHLIVARYWTDIITEEMLASDSNRKEDGTPVRCRTDVSLNLPVPTPSLEEIDELIKSRGPFEWLKMLEDKMNPDIDTEVEHLKSIVGVKSTISYETILENRQKLIDEKEMKRNIDSEKELTEDEIQKLIDDIKN